MSHIPAWFFEFSKQLFSHVYSLSHRRGQQAYIVGGFLRDYYLKRFNPDIDIAVSQEALVIAKDLAKRIKGVYVLLDEAHGCARIVKKIGEQIVTVDISDFRHQTLAQDLALRDFTINSLACPITKKFSLSELENTIMDELASIKDLRRGLIRANHEKIFQDDPLRLMRTFSMSAVHGFKIEGKTKTLIKKNAGLLNQSAPERIREEWFKILASPVAQETLVAMHRAGLLLQVIPQLAVMLKVKQGGYHHLDVFEHSMMVVKEAEQLMMAKSPIALKEYLSQEVGGGHARQSLILMAALLHDIGKPATKKKEQGRYTFHGHEHVGEKMTRHISRMLRLTVKEQYFLEDMVRMHLRIGYLSNFKQPSAKAVYRFMRDAKDLVPALAILAIADQRSTQGSLSTTAALKHLEKIAKKRIEDYFNPMVAVRQRKKRLLTGNDLIKELKLTPSPLFAEILNTVAEEHALGKISTKAEALVLARQIAGK